MDPRYVLDEMEIYEIKPLLESLHEKNKETWEQTRLIMYTTAQVNSSKKLKVNDILEFPWEKKPDTPPEIEDTLENRQKLIREALEYEKLFKLQEGN